MSVRDLRTICNKRLSNMGKVQLKLVMVNVLISRRRYQLFASPGPSTRWTIWIIGAVSVTKHLPYRPRNGILQASFSFLSPFQCFRLSITFSALLDFLPHIFFFPPLPPPQPFLLLPSRAAWCKQPSIIYYSKYTMQVSLWFGRLILFEGVSSPVLLLWW